MKILITGICGFIGAHVAEHFIKNTSYDIVGIDKLSYASMGYDRLRECEVFGHPRVSIYTADLALPIPSGLKQELGNIDVILHLAAETHVENSIVDPLLFVEANIVGTVNLLNYAKGLKSLKHFFYFSTDEVFGSCKPEDPGFSEYDRYFASNPYSASKAGAEQISVAFAHSYKMPVVITRTMNCFGEYQHLEKYIPLVIRHVLQHERIGIHSYPDGMLTGSRKYIHCRNVAAALLFIMDKIESMPGKVQIFHIEGEKEISNLDLALYIARRMGMNLSYELVADPKKRCGHDLRYSLNGESMARLGWILPKTFEASLDKTIDWYLNNPKWLER